MRLIDDYQRIVGQVFEQGGRSLPLRATRQVTRVVFDTGAVTELTDHFHIVARALFNALRLHQLAVVPELF